MNAQEIRRWLRESDPDRLQELWRAADEARRRCVGDAVHLRALVEISSFCVRRCAYCGLRADRKGLERYRMGADEIVACAEQARELGCGTVVLQAGEDPALTREWVEGLLRRLRSAVPELAITLSLGERAEEDLAAWKQAGADRYLLRFETSNRELYDRIHPPLADHRSDRIAILRALRRLGYEVGSGVMIGIPGQTCDDLARDIRLFAELELDMIGVGPFIPHPDTPLGLESVAGVLPACGEGVSPLRPEGILPSVASSVSSSSSSSSSSEEETRRRETTEEETRGRDARVTRGQDALATRATLATLSEEMTYKMIALARLVRPYANIPSTTALATVNRQDGRELGLMRGANVVMPNLTPAKYRRLYEIYPNKACVTESPEDCGGCLGRRIRAIGRHVGAGRGDSRGAVGDSGAVACRVVCGKPR